MNTITIIEEEIERIEDEIKRGEEAYENPECPHCGREMSTGSVGGGTITYGCYPPIGEGNKEYDCPYYQDNNRIAYTIERRPRDIQGLKRTRQSLEALLRRIEREADHDLAEPGVEVVEEFTADRENPIAVVNTETGEELADPTRRGDVHEYAGRIEDTIAVLRGEADELEPIVEKFPYENGGDVPTILDHLPDVIEGLRHRADILEEFLESEYYVQEGELSCPRCGRPLDRDNLNEPVLWNGEERIMCDGCSLATLILLYTRPEPPYVDVGLYQEVTFYSRQLAALTVGKKPSETVNTRGDPGE